MNGTGSLRSHPSPAASDDERHRGGFKGRRHSAETKEKISKSFKRTMQINRMKDGALLRPGFTTAWVDEDFDEGF